MADLSEKERLFRALSGQECDRPPVIAPGGMMSPLTARLLEASGLDGEMARAGPDTMALATVTAREAVGLENLGVPFCLTVEAEALGARVSPGTRSVEPLVVRPALPSAEHLASLRLPDPLREPRMSAVLEAIRILKVRYPDVPVVGNLSGPVTLATAIVPTSQLLRLLVRNESLACDALRLATGTIIGFGEAMLDAGADALVVGDPTATGEIIGPATFKKLVLPQYQAIFSAFRARGAKSVLHICGDVTAVLPSIRSSGADAFSMDSMMSIRKARDQLGPMPLMGNTSTLLLARGTPDRVAAAVRRALAEEVEVYAPSCGLDRSTPLENLRTMCEAVKSWDGDGQADLEASHERR
ncbi:MAG: uroporphyrinogen decarboxylase family protein [Chloroflexota bacterium]|nr:uroporphyrinogen decarboxylase family protein [Chloroflexota bacterium]